MNQAKVKNESNHGKNVDVYFGLRGQLNELVEMVNSKDAEFLFEKFPRDMTRLDVLNYIQEIKDTLRAGFDKYEMDAGKESTTVKYDELMNRMQK